MEGARERFSVILSDEKNEIEEFKKFIKEASNLQANIKEVKSKLVVIENSLKTMNNKFNDRIKNLEEIEKQIKQLNFEVQSNNIDIISQVIIDNLPDGFGGIDDYEKYDEDNLKRIKICYKSTNRTNIKKEKDASNGIGKINILATDEKDFKVEVALGNKGEPNYKETEFIVSNLYRIYKIIVWINTNLHYHE